VAAGSAAVLSTGTELCSEEDVQRLLPKVKVTDVTHAAA
jgi:fructose-1-phosphate kinase PfkB-like protein